MIIQARLLSIAWLAFSLAQTDHDEGARFAPNLKSRADFIAWKEKVELAVRDIEEASTIVPQSFSPSRASLFGDESLTTVISGLFAQAKGSMGCEACVVAIGATSRVAKISSTKSAIIATLKKACVFVKQPTSVCHGIASSTGSVIFDILANLDTNVQGIHHTTCFAFGNHCPLPEVNLQPLLLSERSEPTIKPLPRSGKHKYILHISDLHYDAEYTEGAEADCKKPICCQRDSNSDEENPRLVKSPAHKWGDYKCDINKRLLSSLLKAAANMDHKFRYDMVLFTGDVPAHDMWKEDEARSINSEREAFSMIDDEFHTSPARIYPVIGNHEAVPVNQFPLQGGLHSESYYLYNFLGGEWEKWLPAQAAKSVRKAGFYSVQHMPRLKVIVLNNNVCYTLNFYLLLDPQNNDPNGMLKWLINELQDAEDSGSRVYITSHVPPGGTDCYRHWSDAFYKIIQRYSHIISGQFYGHTHFDEFQLFYSDHIKTKDTAISHAYLAPSITTFGGLNPGFRIYKVDAATYEVIDYTQYYADLSKKDEWEDDAVWGELYSARSTYGQGILFDSESVLSPKFWHQVTERFSTSPYLFDTFYNHRTKGGENGSRCDDQCRENFICTLRAGRARDSCAEIDPFS